ENSPPEHAVTASGVCEHLEPVRAPQGNPQASHPRRRERKRPTRCSASRPKNRTQAAPQPYAAAPPPSTPRVRGVLSRCALYPATHGAMSARSALRLLPTPSVQGPALPGQRQLLRNVVTCRP